MLGVSQTRLCTKRLVETYLTYLNYMQEVDTLFGSAFFFRELNALSLSGTYSITITSRQQEH
jgi:hypothetical protein